MDKTEFEKLEKERIAEVVADISHAIIKLNSAKETLEFLSEQGGYDTFLEIDMDEALSKLSVVLANVNCWFDENNQEQ